MVTFSLHNNAWNAHCNCFSEVHGGDEEMEAHFQRIHGLSEKAHLGSLEKPNDSHTELRPPGRTHEGVREILYAELQLQVRNDAVSAIQ